MNEDMDIEGIVGILAELIVEMDGLLVLLDCLTEKHGDNAILVDSYYAVIRLLRSFAERIAHIVGTLQTDFDLPAPQKSS